MLIPLQIGIFLTLRSENEIYKEKTFRIIGIGRLIYTAN